VGKGKLAENKSSVK